MQARFARSRSLVVTATLVIGLALARCADVRRGLGAACIRNEDCLSNVCAGSVCVAAPPVFDAAPIADAARDTFADAPQDAKVPSIDTGTHGPDANHQDAHVDGHTDIDARVDGEMPDGTTHLDGATHDARPDAAPEAGTTHDAAHDSPAG